MWVRGKTEQIPKCRIFLIRWRKKSQQNQYKVLPNRSKTTATINKNNNNNNNFLREGESNQNLYIANKGEKKQKHKSAVLFGK